jgi:UDP-glucose 6-dehydrogenase
MCAWPPESIAECDGPSADHRQQEHRAHRAPATGWPTSSASAGDDIEFAVVSNPEFLREGSAISDFMNPDRVVLGSLDREAAERVAQLYLPLRTPS